MTSPFLEALRGGTPATTPIWLMRQAGRYLPGYRALREHHDILDIVRDPELALEATLEPVTKFGVDAGIVFSDIMTPLLGLGVDFRIDPGVGPVVDPPLRTGEGLARLGAFDAEASTGFVGETIRRFRERSATPILGFAASPFTLACYLVEGHHERDFPAMRALLAQSEDLATQLLRRLTSVTIDYLRMQERAGADALQLFDTWAGVLSPAQYRRLVLPGLNEIIRSLGKPVIYFSTSSAHLLPEMAELPAAGISIDWRVSLSRARSLLGDRKALQGNLDPTVLLCSQEVMERKALEVLQELPRGDGYIFNLGHGVLPETDPQRVKQLVDFVHRNGLRR